MSGISLRRAGLILLVSSVFAKVVGFLREAVIAATYGTSHTVDVYLAGMTLPALAATVVFYSIPNAFVPLFADPAPHPHVRRQAGGIVCVMFLVAAGMWWLAEPIAALTSSGFPDSLRAEAVIVLRITAAAVALASIEAVARSRLLAQRRFVRPGLSLILQSAVMIVAIWLYPDAGPRTLAWGFVAGNAVAALWNLLPLGGSRWLFRAGAANVALAPPPPSAPMPAPATTGLWIALILVADTIPQLYAIIDRHLGSHLTEGSIAALQYAGLIAVLPTAICGFALGSAIFPYLSRALGENDRGAAADILDRAVAWALIMTVPAMLWLLMFAQDIVLLVYERGAFSEASRLLTAATLMAYAPGVLPGVLAAIFSKVSYSRRRWAPAMLSAILSVAIKAGLSFGLVNTYGTFGLAAASAAGTVVAAVVFAVALPRHSIGRRWRTWTGNALALTVLCALGSAAAIWLVDLAASPFGAVEGLFRLIFAVLLSAALVWVIGPRLGLQEVELLQQSVTRTARRSRTR